MRIFGSTIGDQKWWLMSAALGLHVSTLESFWMLHVSMTVLQTVLHLKQC